MTPPNDFPFVRPRRRHVLLVALLTALLLSLRLQGWAQPAADTPLQPLIDEALAHNLGIRQQYLQQQRQREAVRVARGLMLPTLTANARYSELSGAVVNIGTLINPAFRALNQLTASNSFPTNVDFTLPLRQQTYLSLTQPLFRTDVLYNYRAQQALYTAEDAATAARKRQLVADVQAAYLNWAKASRVLVLLDATDSLLQENLRTSQRLVANDRATPEAVYQARAELADLQQRRAEALRQIDAARQYLNFLLGRELAEPVDSLPDARLRADLAALPQLAATKTEALAQAEAHREELAQLRSSMAAAEYGVKAARSPMLPNLGLGVEYGYQGQEYDFGADRDYLIASLSLSWTLFNGFQNQGRRAQAQLDVERTRLRARETADQIALQAAQAWDDVQVAQTALQTSQRRAEAAAKSFEYVRRRYEEGLANQVEYIQARTSHTNAGVNHILTQYDYLLRRVALERAAALFPLTTAGAAAN